MGKISLNTRSRPTSSRSRAAASVWSSVSKARSWTSSRFGWSIPATSLPNETIGLFTVAKWVSLSLGAWSRAGSANDPDRKTPAGWRAVRIYVRGFAKAILLRWAEVLDRPGSAATGAGRAPAPAAERPGGPPGGGPRPHLHSTAPPLSPSLPLVGVGSSLRPPPLPRLGAP